MAASDSAIASHRSCEDAGYKAMARISRGAVDAAASDPSIDIRRIEVRSRGKTLIDVANLTVAPGAMVAVVGQNGAGKSVLLEALLGLRGAHTCDARILGQTVSHYRTHPRARARYGAQVQRTTFANDFLVRELVAFHAVLYGRSDAEIAERLGIPELSALRYGQLSRGQRMRVHLHLAAAHLPDLLLLDEPTSGLDAAFRAQFIALLLERFAAQGRAVLMVSHQIEEVVLAHTLVWLARGRIKAIEQPRVLMQSRTGDERLTARFPDAMKRDHFMHRAAALPGLRFSSLPGPQEVVLRLDGGSGSTALDMARQAAAVSVALQPTDLSDLYAAE